MKRFDSALFALYRQKSAELTWANYVPASRIHPFPVLNQPGLEVWLKREDEVAYAVSGGKRRKYASLLPWWTARGIEEVAFVAGSNSNNAVGLAQALPEAGIRPHLFTRQSNSSPNPGNSLLTRLLLRAEQRTEVRRDQDPEAHARAYAAQALRAGRKVAWLAEGALHARAMPGALTLAFDLVRNEEQQGWQFDHILIDSGTAMTAGGLLLGLAALPHPATVHVLLCAGKKPWFHQTLTRLQAWLHQTGYPDAGLPPFKLHFPIQGRAFGSVNQSILKSIARYASTSGILFDPVYSIKLIMLAEKLIQQGHLKGRILVIHSGGGQTLPGFAEKFNQLLDQASPPEPGKY